MFLVSLIGCSKTIIDEQVIDSSREPVATRSAGSDAADAAKAQRFTEEMLASLIKGSSF